MVTSSKGAGKAGGAEQVAYRRAYSCGVYRQVYSALEQRGSDQLGYARDYVPDEVLAGFFYYGYGGVVAFLA